MRKAAWYLSVVIYLVSCLFLLSIPTQAADDMLPSILGSASTTEAGDIAMTAIQIKNNPGITAMALDITYDTNVFTLVDVQDKKLMPKSSFVTSPSLNYYPYHLIWTIGTKNVKSSGTLVLLYFKVNENAAPGCYEIEISYKENDIYNVSLENVNFQIINPTIQIEASKTDIPAESIRGDINGNGKIDLNDATLILKTALNLIPTPIRGDMDLNNDGIISLADAQMALKAALNIISLA